MFWFVAASSLLLVPLVTRSTGLVEFILRHSATRGARMVRTRGARNMTAARAAVLQDANLLAEVLSFLPLPGTILLTREVARLWRDTAKRPLLRVALQALALKRAKLLSDAFVGFRTSAPSGDRCAHLHPAVKWLVYSFENFAFEDVGDLCLQVPVT